MKKIYNQPTLNVVEIEEVVAIATSGVYNVGFDGGEFQAPAKSEDWEWQ